MECLSIVIRYAGSAQNLAPARAFPGLAGLLRHGGMIDASRLLAVGTKKSPAGAGLRGRKRTANYKPLRSRPSLADIVAR
jgi:hypothetical protein